MPTPGGPISKHVGLVLDEAQRREVFDEAPVQRGLGAEVELLERAAGGELGEAQAALEAALLDRVRLRGRAGRQELGVGGLVALGVLERGRELLGDGAQAQVVDVRAQLLVDGVGHQHATSKAA